MIQLDLFDFAEEPVENPPPVPRQPPAKKPKPKKTVYRCKCGRSVILHVQAVHIVCGCGRVMREES